MEISSIGNLFSTFMKLVLNNFHTRTKNYKSISIFINVVPHGNAQEILEFLCIATMQFFQKLK